MKALQITLVALLIIALIAGVFVLANWLSTNKQQNMIGHIIYDGHEIVTVEIAEYKRISNGWMQIFTKDGKEYHLNEKNIIIEIIDEE